MSSKATNSTVDILTDLDFQIQFIKHDLILDTPLAELRPQLRQMFDKAFAVVFEVINDLENTDDIKQKFESLKQCIDTFNSCKLDPARELALPILIAKNINGLKNAFREFLYKLWKLPEVQDEVITELSNVIQSLVSLNYNIFCKSILEKDVTQFMEENRYVNQK